MILEGSLNSNFHIFKKLWFFIQPLVKFHVDNLRMGWVYYTYSNFKTFCSMGVHAKTLLKHIIAGRLFGQNNELMWDIFRLIIRIF